VVLLYLSVCCVVVLVTADVMPVYGGWQAVFVGFVYNVSVVSTTRLSVCSVFCALSLGYPSVVWFGLGPGTMLPVYGGGLPSLVVCHGIRGSYWCLLSVTVSWPSVTVSFSCFASSAAAHLS